MTKDSHKVMQELISAITDLAEIVRDLDPGRTRQYAHIEQALESARGHLTQAKAFER
jgi:hypothetical protein